jgi:hypothetical protein
VRSRHGVSAPALAVGTSAGLHVAGGPMHPPSPLAVATKRFVVVGRIRRDRSPCRKR